VTFERQSTVLLKNAYPELERVRGEKLGNQPVINEKSRDIAKKSSKFSEPIFSQARYEDEIQRYRTKRNFDPPKIEKTQFSKTTTLKKDLSINRLAYSRSPNRFN
jgi:hypothetical protein